MLDTASTAEELIRTCHALQEIMKATAEEIQYLKSQLADSILRTTETSAKLQDAEAAVTDATRKLDNYAAKTQQVRTMCMMFWAHVCANNNELYQDACSYQAALPSSILSVPHTIHDMFNYQFGLACCVVDDLLESQD